MTRLATVCFLAAAILTSSLANSQCLVNICFNEGTCYVINGESVCSCPPAYSGQLCELEVVDACVSDPCLNSGNCTSQFGGFQCTCPPGYTERQCQTEIDECSSNPCINGTCVDGINSYTCDCDIGYTGANCDINIDDCTAGDVCTNGGTCVDLIDDYYCNCPLEFAGRNCELASGCNNSFCLNNGICNDNSTCSCVAGYTGGLCETEINECDSNPCHNGTCTDRIGSFHCECFTGYTGVLCDSIIDLCSSSPCLNGALCLSYLNGFHCFCRQGYTGQFCQINIDDCVGGNKCLNGGTCQDGVNRFTCACPAGYRGERCELDNCNSQPCQNNGTCIPDVISYSCECPPEFTGENCSIEVLSPCSSNPCGNGSTCIDVDSVNYTCTFPGLDGENSVIIDIGNCASQPCLNEATCINQVNGYQCVCPLGYTGTNCSIEIDDCSTNPCLNNGTCTDLLIGVSCRCSPGFTGPYCQIDIDECASAPCHSTATCIDEVNDYTCICPVGLTGKQCTVNINDCSDEPCENNGTCIDLLNGYQCSCAPGYTGDHCLINIDNCVSAPCLNNGTCVDGINGYTCICPVHYTGDDCESDVDFCESNPCSPSATCVSIDQNYLCICPPDYTGGDCSVQIDQCESSPCRNNATCNDLIGSFNCTCSPGYTGLLCDQNIDDCSSSPCLNNGTCRDLINSYYCICDSGFTGSNCETNLTLQCSEVTCQNGGICMDTANGFECLCTNGFTNEFCQTDIDECSSNPCLNNGTCTDLVGNYTCDCAPGYDGRNCAIDTDLCDPHPCFYGGTCTQSDGYFNCTCPGGFQGALCERDINECTDDPCLNGGSCVNILGGFICHCPDPYGGDRCEVKLFTDCSDQLCMNNATCVDAGSGFGGSGYRFSCECAPGYTGDLCENIVNQCLSNPCQNGATCEGGMYNFTCACGPDFTGPLCETPIVSCDDVLCLNGGYCVEQYGQFMCVCAPGFTGPMCAIGINECASDPCQNGGTCQDRVAAYQCHCLSGFTGQNCQINIDDCQNVTCENGGSCVDGVNSYSCQCVPGWTGVHCESMIDECKGVNCLNNGTCVDLLNSFHCDCPPGFTDQYCQTDIDDCSGVNCNNGTCYDLVNAYRCQCHLGYMGDHCEAMVNDCLHVTCMNGGTCTDLLNDFRCDCPVGYTGQFCEVNIDDCANITCLNDGECIDLVNGYYCNCSIGFTGDLCETNIDDCASTPCLNNATCIDGVASVTCSCSPLYTGTYCDTEIDLCSLEAPCLNGGSCQPEVQEGLPSYSCMCSPPYRGDNCEIQDQCLLSPCQNNGTCLANITRGDYICQCADNYYGTDCESFDFCHSGPCLNGGSCTNEAMQFVCACPAAYTGVDCGVLITPCYYSPCQNGGTCIDDLESNTYMCDCPVGYTGLNCSQATVSDTPYFSGRSYILVPYSPSNSNTSLIDRLWLQTNSISGLILYTSEEDHSSFLSLGLEEGLLSLRLRQEGTLVNALAHYQPVADGRWHSVSLRQNGLDLSLEVDGYRSATQLIDMSLSMQPAVTYLGGFDNFSALPHQVGQSTGLVGLLNISMELGGEPVHIVDESIAGRNIGDPVSDSSLCRPGTCTNGGICVETDLTYSCLCPLGFRGSNCEQDIDVRIPYFSSDSYLIIPNLNYSSTLEVDLILHTVANDGILFLLYDATNMTTDYFSLSLEEGSLTIRYSLSNSMYSQSYPGNVSDGNWHILTVQYNTSGLYLSVNETVVIYSNVSLSTLMLNSPLFLGGVPNGLYTPFPSERRFGLDGCIRDLQINNGTVDLIADSLYGLGLMECPRPVCSYVQCTNGGTCRNNNTADAGFTCDCLYGYAGVHCEIFLPLCSPNPCSSGGVCREFDDRTFTCTCTLGRQGRLCEQELNITVPAFYNSSYITYSSLSNVQNILSITILFNPSQPNGLILFNGFSNSDFSDYISIALVNSRVVYRFNLGSGQAELVSSQPLPLNQWHTVTANRTGRVGYLQVNQQPLITGTSLGAFTGLNVAGDMWLGGTSQFMIVSQYTGVANGLTGCISSVSINGAELDLILGAEAGINIGECNVSTCALSPCDNGGTCVESGNSFTCVCSPGYTGALCGVLTLACVSGPCLNGGTCQEGFIGGSFTCLCPLGFGGDLCGDSVAVIIPSFNVTSFQQYPAPASIALATAISLSFHPLSHTGIILYIGDVSQSRDFLSLSLVNRRVEFRYDLGSGPAMLVSPLSIVLNQWHSITAVRTRRSGSLTVNGSSTVTGISPGTTTLLNTVGGLYIGGGDEYSRVSANAGAETGLTGCVDTNSVQINGVGLGNVVSSRSVSQCSIDLCTSNPCVNGDCTSTGPSFTCTCPLGYVGSQCETAMSIETPSFAGNSFLSYPSLSNSSSLTTLHLEIYPNSTNGLILYNGEGQSNGADYMALTLKNGRVVLQYELGSGPVTITSESSLTLGQWHTISVSRNGPMGQLVVDGNTPVTGSASNNSHSLQLGGALYIGGVPDVSLLPVALGVREGMVGCVRELRVSPNDRSISLIADATGGVSVTECTAMIGCNVNPCLNGGRCVAEIVNGSVSESCECSLPYADGDYCTERVSFVSPNFVGSSYVQFPLSNIPINSITVHTEIKLSFTPYNTSGLLFYLGHTNPASGNYILVGLNNGRIDYRFQLGSGVGIIQSSQPVTLGQLYNITLLRTDNKGRLLVSRQSYVDGVSPGASRHLNLSPYDFALYIGGAPDVPFISQQVYQTGFTGCFPSTVQIGYASSAQPVSFEVSTLGQYVTPCL